MIVTYLISFETNVSNGFDFQMSVPSCTQNKIDTNMICYTTL